MYEPIIEVNNLYKYFKTENRNICTLDNINFKINKGEIIGIIGDNGAGKTTLLKLLAGIILPSKGSITIKGETLPLLELGIGFHPELTGKENIFLYSSILGIPKKVIKTKIGEIIKFSELEAFIEEKLKTYSAGMKLRLAFSIGIQCPHDIFLIDEVLAVGDRNFQKKCVRKIEELKKKNKTFLFVSHNFSLIKKICDKVIFLDNGRIKSMGKLSQVFCDYEKTFQEKKEMSFSLQKRKINYVINWWLGIKQPPFTLEINPSKRCNSQGLFCEFREFSQEKKDELPCEEYKRLIKNAKILGVSEIRIVGKGEPFIRGDMVDIIKCVKENKLTGFICTNGLLLTEETIKKMIYYKWNRIEISLHGSSSKIHDTLMNKQGAFDRTLKNIKLIKKFKILYNSNKPWVGISTVLNKLNYKDIPDIVKLASRLQVDSVSLNPLIINKYNKDLRMTDKELEEFKDYLEESKKLLTKYNLDNNYHSLTLNHIQRKDNIFNMPPIKIKKNILDPHCYFPWLSLSIDQNGYASQCSFCKGTESIKEKSLEDIWYGQEFKKIREKIKNGTIPPECTFCCIPYVLENKFIKEDLINAFKAV